MARLHVANPYCTTVIGVVVSLVSVNAKAPPFTSTGALVSDVCCAIASTCAVSNDVGFEVGGGGVGGIIGGVVEVMDGTASSLPPHPAATLTAAHRPIKRILDFMGYSS
jgi:hypothetical protein